MNLSLSTSIFTYVSNIVPTTKTHFRTFIFIVNLAKGGFSDTTLAQYGNKKVRLEPSLLNIVVVYREWWMVLMRCVPFRLRVIITEAGHYDELARCIYSANNSAIFGRCIFKGIFTLSVFQMSFKICKENICLSKLTSK